MQSKRDNESVKAYQAYCDYRDMGIKRSLVKLHEVYLNQTSIKPPTKTIDTIRRWSASHEWQNRVSDWQIEQQKISDEHKQQQRLKQREQRQDITVALNGMLIKVMQRKNDSELEPSALNQLANAASKILDQSRQEFNDLPTQRSEGTMEHDIVDSTDEERLARLADILDRARNRRDGTPS